MTEPEIRLKCMEMAIVQARAEGKPGDREFIAELQDWFYHRIIAVPPSASEPEKKPRKVGGKADQLFD